MLGSLSQFRLSQREFLEPFRFWPWLFELLLRAVAVLGFVWVLASQSQGAVVIDDFDNDPFNAPYVRSVSHQLSTDSPFRGNWRRTSPQAPQLGDHLILSLRKGLFIRSDPTIGPNEVVLSYTFSRLGRADLESMGTHILLDFTIDDFGEQSADTTTTIEIGMDVSIFNPGVTLTYELTDDSFTVPLSDFATLAARDPSSVRNLRMTIRTLPGFEGTITSLSIIPEPSTALLHGLSLGCLGLRRRRDRGRTSSATTGQRFTPILKQLR